MISTMTLQEKFEEVKDKVPFDRLGKHGRDGQFLYGDVIDWCRDYFGESKDSRLAFMLIGYWFTISEPSGKVSY